jgi:hypothetical protein
MDFEDFIAFLQVAPHITEKIIRLLNLTDIVSCLRTCKSLRKVVVCILEERPKLKLMLETDASKSVCMKGQWKK